MSQQRQPMTDVEHQATTRRLQAAIHEHKNAIPGLASLAEKIAAKGNVRALEQQLREHKLNYYALVDVSADDGPLQE